MPKIVMLTPFPDRSPLTEFARQEFRDISDMTVVGTDTGLEVVTRYHHIEYHIGPMLDKAVEMEHRGDCDAFIVGCFGDPGVMAVRQATSLPVLGTAEASLAVASVVGDRIGIVIPERQFMPPFQHLIHGYQFSGRVVAMRSVEDFVPESIQTQPELSMKKMAQTCLEVIRDDDADVVIFGCIGFSWMVSEVRALLAKEGLETPLIEPGIAAYRAAKMVVDLGLNQDRRKLGRCV